MEIKTKDPISAMNDLASPPLSPNISDADELAHIPRLETEKGVRRFWIVRHGETDANRLGLLQGSGNDLSLNSRGKDDSECVFAKGCHLSLA